MPDIHLLPEVLTVDEVADYLRVSRATVCRWCNTGKLPAFKIGKVWRVQKIALANHINQRTKLEESGTSTEVSHEM